MVCCEAYAFSERSGSRHHVAAAAASTVPGSSPSSKNAGSIGCAVFGVLMVYIGSTIVHWKNWCSVEVRLFTGRTGTHWKYHCLLEELVLTGRTGAQWKYHCSSGRTGTQWKYHCSVGELVFTGRTGAQWKYHCSSGTDDHWRRLQLQRRHRKLHLRIRNHQGIIYSTLFTKHNGST